MNTAIENSQCEILTALASAGVSLVVATDEGNAMVLLSPMEARKLAAALEHYATQAQRREEQLAAIERFAGGAR